MIKALFTSKKFVVFLTTALTAAAATFGGLPEEQAASFVDKLVAVAMAYLGGQGLADAGKYAGEAIAQRGAVIPATFATVSSEDDG